MSTSLEQLASACEADKLDHGYLNVYGMLFEPMRASVRNMTEIGVMNGAGFCLWSQFFGSSASIWAFDIKLTSTALDNAPRYPNVHAFEASSQDEAMPARLGLAESSMDIVIDDGDHSPAGIERTLKVFWPLLRAGGYYVIEDVATGSNAHGRFPNKNMCARPRPCRR